MNPHRGALVACLTAAILAPTVALPVCLDDNYASFPHEFGMTDDWDVSIAGGTFSCALTISQDACLRPDTFSSSVTATGTCSILGAVSLAGTIVCPPIGSACTLTLSGAGEICASITVSATTPSIYDVSSFTGDFSCNSGGTLPLTGTRHCGNGVADAAETCGEPSLDAAGPCCSTSNCRYRPAGSDCIPEGLGECLGSGTCGGGSSEGCSAGPPPYCVSGIALPAKSSVVIRNDADPNRDKLVWRWISSGPFVPPLAGVPSKVATFCVVDLSGAIRSKRVVDTTDWIAIADGGVRFRGEEDGIQSILLKPGTVGKVKVKGKGSALSFDPSMLPLSEPVHVFLLVTDDLPFPPYRMVFGCFGATYGGAQVRENGSVQFKARLP